MQDARGIHRMPLGRLFVDAEIADALETTVDPGLIAPDSAPSEDLDLGGGPSWHIAPLAPPEDPQAEARLSNLAMQSAVGLFHPCFVLQRREGLTRALRELECEQGGTRMPERYWIALTEALAVLSNLAPIPGGAREVEVRQLAKEQDRVLAKAVALIEEARNVMAGWLNATS